MRKITTEILMIVLATMFMLSGLILTLSYLDGRMLIGIALMISGIALWIVILRRALCQE